MSYQYQIKSWNIKYGQISIGTEDFDAAMAFFQPYLNRTFTLKTINSEIPKRKFNVKPELRTIRLSAEKFFGKLEENDIIYFKPIDAETLGVHETLPVEDELPSISLEEDTSIENRVEVKSNDEAPIEVTNSYELLFFELLKYMILKGDINEIREISLLNKLALEWGITNNRVNFLKQLARIE